MDNFYVYLSSADSITFFPNNKPHDFTINLGRSINLEGKWCCALKEINCQINEKLPEILYILGDCCSQSYARNTYMSILRTVSIDVQEGLFIEEFSDAFYKDVNTSNISTINISIRDKDGSDVDFKSKVFNCILHFKRIKNNCLK